MSSASTRPFPEDGGRSIIQRRQREVGTYRVRVKKAEPQWKLILVKCWKPRRGFRLLFIEAKGSPCFLGAGDQFSRTGSRELGRPSLSSLRELGPASSSLLSADSDLRRMTELGGADSRLVSSP